MTTKKAKGRITGLLALTFESSTALAVGDPVHVTGDYTVAKADGTKFVVGHVSVANVKRDGTTAQYPVAKTPGDVTVEARGFEVRVGTAAATIAAGDEVAYTTGGALVPLGVGQTTGTNEVQKITVATSGNTTVGFQGVTAAATAIAADAPGAATLTGLLEGLPDINVGDVVVTVGSGGDAGKLIVTFQGRWAGQDVPPLTATGTGASVATTTAGVAGSALRSIGVALTGAAATAKLDILVR